MTGIIVDYDIGFISCCQFISCC